MKIVKDAADRVGGVSELQKMLVRIGVSISQSGLSQASNHSKESLRLDVLAGIVEVAYKGDWTKAGKLIVAEFLPKNKA